jgi:hypothetical protein
LLMEGSGSGSLTNGSGSATLVCTLHTSVPDMGFAAGFRTGYNRNKTDKVSFCLTLPPTSVVDPNPRTPLNPDPIRIQIRIRIRIHNTASNNPESQFSRIHPWHELNIWPTESNLLYTSFINRKDKNLEKTLITKLGDVASLR